HRVRSSHVGAETRSTTGFGAGRGAGSGASSRASFGTSSDTSSDTGHHGRREAGMTTENGGCGDQGATLHAVSSAVLAVTRHLSVLALLEVTVRAGAHLLDARYPAMGVPAAEGSFAVFVVEGVTAEERERFGPLPRQNGMLAAMLKSNAPKRLGDIR